MRVLGFAFMGAYASALLAIGAPMAAIAQAQLAPPNLQQQRCVEAFADTPEEQAIKEAIGKPPADVLEEVNEAEGWEGLKALRRWTERRAIEVFGSEEAARAAGEKIRIEKYTRRLDLLRKAARAGHLPSLYRLVQTSGGSEYEGIPGAMGPDERQSALRTLYESHFPLVPQILGGECLSKLEDVPEPTLTPDPGPGCTIRELLTDSESYGPHNPPIPDFCTDDELVDWSARQEARLAAFHKERARHLAEMAAKRAECLDLIREGGFRGHMYAWERLASYDFSTVVSEVGIVPPVEHYAWLELEKLAWRERDWEDRYSVPLSNQQMLEEKFSSEEQLVEAVALAKKYSTVLWPRRIDLTRSNECQLLPQFAGDPDPFASDLLPR